MKKKTVIITEEFENHIYTPTSCEEQTMVKTGYGNKYHAPTSCWVPYSYETMAQTSENINTVDRDIVAMHNQISVDIETTRREIEQNIRRSYLGDYYHE